MEKTEKSWEKFADPKELGKTERALKSLDKTLEKIQERVDKVDKSWQKFGDPKALKNTESGLQRVDRVLDKIQKKVEQISKTGLNLKGKLDDSLGNQLDQLKTKVDSLNKQGVKVKAELQGGKEVVAGLDEIQQRVDKLKNADIVIKVRLDDKDAIARLQSLEDTKTRLTKDEAIVTVRAEGADETQSALQAVTQVASEAEDSDVTVDIEADGAATTKTQIEGVEKAASSADRQDVNIKVEADGVTETIAELKTAKHEADDLNRTKVKIDVDATAAEHLPALLGDCVSGLQKLRALAVIVSVAAIPAMIASLAAAGSAAAVAGAAAGALATGLGVGLAGAATTAYGALGLAYGGISATGVAAKAAISNILGLDKGITSLGGTVKEAQDEVKKFQDLVDKMPAGSDAAAAAQERLSIAQEKEAKATQLQIDWWNKYGTAANGVARSLNTIHLGLVEIVNDAGGQLIPIIQDFLDIAEHQLPNVEQAFRNLTRGVDEGTAELRNFLNTSQGLEDVRSIILAVGDAAGMAFNIMSNGAIVALQIIEEMLPRSLDLLKNLSGLAREAGEWAQSAEGMQQIADAVALAAGYAVKLGDAVENLAVTLGHLGQAFIESGLVDMMLDGFVQMTQALRDVTSGANDADSAFRIWLEAAKPIITAASEAVSALVTQIVRVVDEVTRAVDPNTGLPIMVEILNGIRDAAEPLGNLLISTFQDLGPIIAELIPEIAQFMQIFLGSTPELKIFLEMFTGLLQAFNDLPDPIQTLIGRMLALTIMMKGLANVMGAGGGVSGAAGLISSFLQWNAIAEIAAENGTKIITPWTIVKTLLSGINTALIFVGDAFLLFAGYVGDAIIVAGEAALGLGALTLALVALAAAAVVVVAVTFDYEAAQEAYTEARESGDNMGKAFGKAVIEGLKSVPIAGDIVAWADDNILTPLDNWLTNTDFGFDEWLGRIATQFDEWGAGDPLGTALSDLSTSIDNWAAEDPFGTAIADWTRQFEAWGESDPIGAAVGAQNQPLDYQLGALAGTIAGKLLVWTAAFDAWGQSDPVGGALSAISARVSAYASEDTWGPTFRDWSAKFEAWGASDPAGTAISAISARVSAYASEDTWGPVLRGWLAAFDAWGQGDPLAGPIEAINTRISNYASEDVWGPVLTDWTTKFDDWGNSDPVGDALSSITTSVNDWGNSDPVGDALENFKQGFLDRFNAIKDEAVDHSIFPEMFAAIVQIFTDLPGALAGPLSDLYDTVTGAFQSILDTLITSSTVPELVDGVLGEWDRLNTESETKWATDLYNTITEAAQSIFDYVVNGSIFPDLVDGSLAEWDRLNSESATKWATDLYNTIVDAATSIYNEVVSGSIFPDLVNDSVSEWERLDSESESPWSTLYDNITTTATNLAKGVLSTFGDLVTDAVELFETLATKAAGAMTRAYNEIVNHSIVPDMVREVLDWWAAMATGAEEISNDNVEYLLDLWNTLPDGLRRTLGYVGEAIADFTSTQLIPDDYSIVPPDFSTRTYSDFVEPVSTAMDGALTEADEGLRAVQESLRDSSEESRQQWETWWNALDDDVKLALGDVAHYIADFFGDLVSEDFSIVPADYYQKTYDGLTQPVADAAGQVQGDLGGMADTAQGQLGSMATNVEGAFNLLVTVILGAVGKIVEGAERILSGLPYASFSPAGGTGGTTGATGKQKSPAMLADKNKGVSGMAHGGVQAQGPTGGVSDGMNPRVVFGEQQRNTREAYIVEDRPDQMPYLEEAASWHGMGLWPLDGMARGGTKRGKGKKGGKGGGRGGPLQRQIGRTFRQVPHFPREQATTSSAGSRTSPTSSTGSTSTSGSGDDGSTDSGTNISINIVNNVSSTGGSSSTSSSSPSASAFPENTCDPGVWASQTPVEGAQQPYYQDAMAASGMKQVPANPALVGDHVNITSDVYSGDACSGGSGMQAPGVWPTLADNTGVSGLSGYDQCLPSNAMAPGGILGMADGGTSTTITSNFSVSQNPGFTLVPARRGGRSTSSQQSSRMTNTGTRQGGAQGVAHPVSWQSVPLGWWDQFLASQWYGDPGLDWPILDPPSGWDPSSVYSAANGQMSRGGLMRNGIQYFEGGGLTSEQIQAGLDAGNSVMGAPYSYGMAGEDGGYDCAGIWNWIEAAVIWGAPQVGKRWDTFAASSGDMSGNWESGAVDYGMNIGVDLGGWGGNDGTHMAGDLNSSLFEANSYFGYVGDFGNDHTAFGTWWTLGSAGDIANQIGAAPGFGDPSGLMSDQVGSWWGCQAAPVPDIGAAPPYEGVENYMSTLPGMTEQYLQDVGQAGLGSLTGYDSSSMTPDQWAIAALQAAGLDPDQESIDKLMYVMNRETGGTFDPSVTSPDGAMGLTQLMPDSWSQFNQGGDPYEPIANLLASIYYQYYRFGGLVDMEYYAKGGLALSPHVGVVGDGGTEAMIPLENARAMAMLRAGLGTGGGEDVVAELTGVRADLAAIRGRVDYQTDVMGERVGGGMDRRIRSHPSTGAALKSRADATALRELIRR